MLQHEKLQALLAGLVGNSKRGQSPGGLSFRNGPIENVHAGKCCPTCAGDPQYSHITQEEMREIMKSAVDRLYTFLVLKRRDPQKYQALLALGERYTNAWDEPTFTKNI